jgi:hypothetical protein
MIFSKLTKTYDNFYKKVQSPLDPGNGSQLSTLRPIGPTSPTIWPHKLVKSVKSHHSYVCRAACNPVFQRTRTNLPNYLAHKNARIFPLDGACSQPPFWSHLRTQAYCVHSGGAL